MAEPEEEREPLRRHPLQEREEGRVLDRLIRVVPEGLLGAFAAHQRADGAVGRPQCGVEADGRPPEAEGVWTLHGDAEQEAVDGAEGRALAGLVRPVDQVQPLLARREVEGHVRKVRELLEAQALESHHASSSSKS